MTYRPPTETVLGGCAAHTEPHTGLGIPTMGREHGPTFTRPYRFARRYFDDAGEVLCDRCVVEGIKEGSIDLANPADLSYAERDVKEALEHWGEIALDTFGRGIEAADRSARSPASAALLVSAAARNDLEPSVSDIKAGDERQCEGAAVADDPARSLSSLPPDVRHTALGPPQRGGFRRWRSHARK